jgi:hypothetical protein
MKFFYMIWQPVCKHLQGRRRVQASSIQLCQSDVIAGLNLDHENQRLAILHGKGLSSDSSPDTRLFSSLLLTEKKKAYTQDKTTKESGLTIVSPVRIGQVAGWICRHTVATTLFNGLLLLLLFGVIIRFVIMRVDGFSALLQLVQILLLRRS